MLNIKINALQFFNPFIEKWLKQNDINICNRVKICPTQIELAA